MRRRIEKSNAQGAAAAYFHEEDEPSWVTKLTRQMKEMERELEAFKGPGGALSNPDPTSFIGLDTRWNCRKCGTMMALYDMEEDVLRIRNKDQFVFARVGGADMDKLVDVLHEWVSGVAVEIPEVALGTLANAVSTTIIPGFVEIICRRCGQPNIQTFATEEEVAESRDLAKPAKP